jgi:hypothetical protein
VRQGDQPIAVVIPQRGVAGQVVGDGSSLVFNRSSSEAGLGGAVAPAGVVYLLPPSFPAAQLASLPTSDQLRAEVEDHWSAVLARATQIDTPEPFLNDLIRSSQVRCLIAARNEADGTRVAPWAPHSKRFA